jgi:AcrR family transcriptional regulator
MTTKQQHALQTRQRLLEAALNITRAQGAAGLTLDAVAREAGISKGGLLHHFPNKEALIETLLEQLFTEFEARVNDYARQETAETGRWLRAYVRATFDPASPPIDVWIALLPVIQDERLLALIRADTEQWRTRLLNDGVPRGRAMVIWQAADAFWIDHVFRLNPTEPAAHAEMMTELLKLTEGL